MKRIRKEIFLEQLEKQRRAMAETSRNKINDSEKLQNQIEHFLKNGGSIHTLESTQTTRDSHFNGRKVGSYAST